MGFGDAVRTCLLLKYADFRGRATRSEFWYFVLFEVVVGWAAALVDAILHTPRLPGPDRLLGTLVSLALVVPETAVTARRLHDTGRSGWWQLLLLPGIPFMLVAGPAGDWAGVVAFLGFLVLLVCSIVLLVWWTQDSGPDNRYGPDPKAMWLGGVWARPARYR